LQSCIRFFGEGEQHLEERNEKCFVWSNLCSMPKVAFIWYCHTTHIIVNAYKLGCSNAIPENSCFSIFYITHIHECWIKISLCAAYVYFVSNSKNMHTRDSKFGNVYFYSFHYLRVLGLLCGKELLFKGNFFPNWNLLKSSLVPYYYLESTQKPLRIKLYDSWMHFTQVKICKKNINLLKPNYKTFPPPP